MTEKLFYKDSHLSKFDAEVLSCVRAKRQQVKDSFGRLDGKAGEYYEIELDRTAFFPEGGGQYADTGVLYMADDDTCGLDETARKKVQVLDVRERNGRIFHITDGFIEAKTAVKGSIDWEERFMKMQQHTGEHIVSGLIHAAYGYNNVGFHLGSEDCTMDFDGEITEEELRRIEAEENKAVWKNLKVFTHYPKKEELSQIEYRSKIEIEGQVRIIEIPKSCPHTLSLGAALFLQVHISADSSLLPNAQPHLQSHFLSHKEAWKFLLPALPFSHNPKTRGHDFGK